MNTLSEPILDGALNQCGLLVLAAPYAASEQMLAFAARLAGRAALQVIDGGNRFNAYRVARALRRTNGRDMNRALERIFVRRAFTCYQMLTLLELTPGDATPTLGIDFLDTFYDQSVPLAERQRLLDLCLDHLHRLSQRAPVVISLRPPPPPHDDPSGLVERVQAAADLVWFPETPATSYQLPLL